MLRERIALSSAGVTDLLYRLHGEAKRRLDKAYAPRSRGVLATALKHFARFAASCPQRQLFKEPRWRGDHETSAWNEWTLVLFAVFMATKPSERTGEKLKVKTVESYIALLKGHLNFKYEFELVDRSPRLKGLLKDLRSEEPEILQRRKRRGLRRRHLVRMWERLPLVRETSADAVNNHALLVVAWHVLARGGELAPAAKVWSADTHPTRADVTFKKNARQGKYAVLYLRPLKKRGKGIAPKVPQIISEHDGGGSDAYAALWRLCKYDPVPEALKAVTPLFRRSKPDGAMTTHMTVKMMRALVKERMVQLGYDHPEHWGAHSCRIGGATDVAATGNTSPLLLQAKGRWAGDIGRIYARMTRRGQIAASKLMQKARGRDLEEILGDFVQPAL